MNKTTFFSACLALGACGAQPSNPSPEPANSVSAAATSVADLKMNGGH